MLPIERPGKIVCVGLNYRDHAEEQGVELPEEPLLFAKWPNTLIGPGDPIVIPPLVTRCDYEAELGVVVGERVSRVSKENALEAVRGYLCANDVSARNLQFNDGQWTRGKSVDTFCPVGALVPAAEVADPHALRVRAIVSGEVLQDSTTANLIFGVDEIISHASQTMMLEPGDLILTGTPAGVGVFRDPQRFLQPGDEVTIEIEPGERLVETRLARELGTSQAPVREALRDLELLRLVESEPFRGARVRAVDDSRLLPVFPVRAVLEELAASEAARDPERDLSALERELEAMREAAAAADWRT